MPIFYDLRISKAPNDIFFLYSDVIVIIKIHKKYRWMSSSDSCTGYSAMMLKFNFSSTMSMFGLRHVTSFF